MINTKIKQSKLVRACDAPVSKDGCVIRESCISQLESDEFCFRRMHYELSLELSGSVNSNVNKFSPSLSTGLDCFFRSLRGKLNSKCNGKTVFPLMNVFFSYVGGSCGDFFTSKATSVSDRCLLQKMPIFHCCWL